jgi:hypothetical protein
MKGFQLVRDSGGPDGQTDSSALDALLASEAVQREITALLDLGPREFAPPWTAAPRLTRGALESFARRHLARGGMDETAPSPNSLHSAASRWMHRLAVLYGEMPNSLAQPCVDRERPGRLASLGWCSLAAGEAVLVKLEPLDCERLTLGILDPWLTRARTLEIHRQPGMPLRPDGRLAVVIAAEEFVLDEASAPHGPHLGVLEVLWDGAPRRLPTLANLPAECWRIAAEPTGHRPPRDLN